MREKEKEGGGNGAHGNTFSSLSCALPPPLPLSLTHPASENGDDPVCMYYIHQGEMTKNKPYFGL